MKNRIYIHSNISKIILLVTNVNDETSQNAYIQQTKCAYVYNQTISHIFMTKQLIKLNHHA